VQLCIAHTDTDEHKPGDTVEGNEDTGDEDELMTVVMVTDEWRKNQKTCD